MKVVIADTSPINYLILIDCIDVLRSLYLQIVIPSDVVRELSTSGAPPNVAVWMRTPPEWIEIRSPLSGTNLPAALTEADLDAGEQAAIQLALAERDVLLLIDEATGRSVASLLGVPTTGTLGVLVAAAKEGLVDLKTSLGRLQNTNFRISNALIDKVLADAS
jgi:predicted nucleic acid-binding protein